MTPDALRTCRWWRATAARVALNRTACPRTWQQTTDHRTLLTGPGIAGAERNAMNYPDMTERGAQRAEELVSWTCGERLRFLWYRLRLTVNEMNHATRRLLELQTRLP